MNNVERMSAFEVDWNLFTCSEPNVFGNPESFDLSDMVREDEKRWVTRCASDFARRPASSAPSKIEHHFVKSAPSNLQKLPFTLVLPKKRRSQTERMYYHYPFELNSAIPLPPCV